MERKETSRLGVGCSDLLDLKGSDSMDDRNKGVVRDVPITSRRREHEDIMSPLFGIAVW